MFNKAILVGRLTKDPETKSTTSGALVTRFTIAIDRRFQKQGEEKKTDFINIVAFNKTAEFVAKYFEKGQAILVSGSIQTRTWDGQDGEKRYATEVFAEEVDFYGSKNNSSVAPKKESADPLDALINSDSEFVKIDNDDLPF